jgi:predicted phosphodiesterase
MVEGETGMKILIISDVHGNLEALEAILAATRGTFEELWGLGDFVGYGPDPNGCIDLLREHNVIGVMGNHDLGASRGESWDFFSPVARTMIEWTAGELTGDNRIWLKDLPELRYQAGFTLVHGSPADPVWRYILDSSSAAEAFAAMNTEAGFCGHTHLPMVFSIDRRMIRHSLPRYGKSVKPSGLMWIANPGSSGIPRDGDSRAAFIIADTKSGRITFHRVSYPSRRTIVKLKRIDAPAQLIRLLETG